MDNFVQNFAWLGITDEENEGTWLDTNGYPLIWTNFNNQEDGKDHAKIKVESEPPGKWKYSSGNDEFATLCLREIPPNIPDGYLSTSLGASQTMEYKFYFNKNYNQDGHAIIFTSFKFNNNDNTKNHARLMQDINGNWNGQWKYQEGNVPGILLCMRIV